LHPPNREMRPILPTVLVKVLEMRNPN